MALPPLKKAALQQVIETSHPVANMAIMSAEVADDVPFTDEASVLQLSNQLMTMQATEFTAPFDWQAEFADRQKALEDPEYIKSVDLEELRKIMTAHIRIDRMSDGHLDSLIKSGYWNQCLARIVIIYEDMDDE